MRRLPLLALIGSLACAGPVEDSRDGGIDAGLGLPAPAIPEARLLYFVLGTDAWVSTAAGTEGRSICPDAVPYPDADGGRALCVPNGEEGESETPLSLFDLASLTLTTTYEGWVRQDDHPPILSPDGSRVAYRALDSELGRTVVRAADDGSNPLGVVVAFDPLGFAGDDAVLVDSGVNAPGLWGIGTPEAQTVEGTHATVTGVERPGVVYEYRSEEREVRFLDAFGQRAELGVGRLGGVWGRRVLLRPSGSAGELVLVDLLDLTYRPVMPLERPSHAIRRHQLRLVGPSLALVEEIAPGRCGTRRPSKVVRSVLVDFDAETERVLAETDGHQAHVAADGSRALIAEVDGCGDLLGPARILNLDPDVDEDEAEQPLEDFLVEPPLAVALGPSGRYVAVALQSGLQVIDLRLDPPQVRVAASGGAGGWHLVFR